MSGLLKTLRQFAIAALGVLLVASVGAAQSTKAKPRPPISKERGWQVTKVFLDPFVPETTIAPCPADFVFLGRITTDGPAEVKYTWVSSDGGTWPEQRLKFPSSRGKNVTVAWKVGKPGKTVKVWLQLKVLSPNEVVSNRSSLVVQCEK
jgi:hypothetical protein